MPRAFFISRFRSLAPAHHISQTESLAWLADAHTRAAQTAADRAGAVFSSSQFREQTLRRLQRFGCGEDKIGRRGHELEDCSHTDWRAMQVYRLHERPEGEGMLARTQAYAALAGNALHRLYAEEHSAAPDLIHVTCTGYESPSAAQRVVAERGWGRATRVTHAYHMGCYAALPALRMAAGFAGSPRGLRTAPSRQSDVVHTELCSLHVNPLLQTPEQFVIQTLFADGSIKYCVTDASESVDAPGFELLALAEELVPDSSDAMRWICSDWGMQMSLARDVPQRIGSILVAFVERLCAQAELSAAERAGALFAIHPGGPKILDQVRDGLRLSEAQIAASRHVLFSRGNMSSATLPHVWQRLLETDELSEGQPVVSLAFGPGLTVCGAVMRKRAR